VHSVLVLKGGNERFHRPHVADLSQELSGLYTIEEMGQAGGEVVEAEVKEYAEQLEF
jgi:hypothetical protein